MNDYRQIADDVRNFVERIDQTPDPTTEALAQAYANVCRQVNDRLRRCGDLLRRGLRSEALHLAQEPPDLLDMVAALDVPNLTIWENTCAQNDLTRGPRLLVDVAAELNEAFALEAPLQSSLDELRLLVLARAPAIDRLRVIRRLRSLDPNTPHWQQDVADLERAAVETLRADAINAVRNHDGTAARQLLADLTATEWTIHPPADVVEPLLELSVRAMAQELLTAEATKDVRAGKRSLKALHKLLDKHAAGLPPELVPTVDRVSAWLSESAQREKDQKAFDEQCAMLEAEIGRGSPRPHLRALYAQLMASGLPIPSRTQQRYEQAIRNRSGVGLVQIVLALLVIAAIVAGIWWLTKRQGNHIVPATVPAATRAADGMLRPAH